MLWVMTSNHSRRRISRRPVADRFWEKVRRSTPDECWEWTASRSAGSGYGQFTLDYKTVHVHRLSYIFTHGPIPDGMHVLHRCDNRGCVNPSHLFLGKHLDNMRDMDQKGRRVNSPHAGESNGSAKITENDVRQIRALAGTMPQRMIGERFGIDQTTVSLIVTRKKWQHVA